MKIVSLNHKLKIIGSSSSCDQLKRTAKMQFPAEKYFPLSDVDKIKVIDKLEVADSESDFG